MDSQKVQTAVSRMICKQYESMNNGPHEGILITARAPCLLAQMAFWMPEGESWGKRAENLKAVFGILCSSLSEVLIPKQSGGEDSGASFESGNGTRNSANGDSHASVDSGKNSRATSAEKEKANETPRIRSWSHSVATNGCVFDMFVYGHSEYWRMLIKVEAANGAIIASGANLSPNILSALNGVASRDSIDEFGKLALDVLLRAGKTPGVPEDYFSCMFASFLGLVLNADGQTIAERKDGAPNWSRLRSLPDAHAYIVENWKNIKPLHGLGNADVELTASTFNDHRALYVSTLGHPKSPALGGHVPVVYSIYSCIDDEWQLGRVLDTVNSMGVVRLAALRDIDKISGVAESLRIARAGLKSGQSVRELRESFEDILRKDMSARIERAGRYWRQLQKRITFLRINPIEGFQPYDRFVNRRIGDTVEFIEGVGKQLALVRKEIDLRYQVDQAEAIVRLQRTAEMLSIFPIAYYGVGLVPLGLKQWLHSKIWLLDGMRWRDFVLNAAYLEGFLALAFPLFVAWCLVRLFHRHLRGGRKKQANSVSSPAEG